MPDDTPAAPAAPSPAAPGARAPRPAAVPCRACPLRGRDLFVPMTPDEVAFMEGFKSGELHVAPGAAFLPEGAASDSLFTVLRGQGLRYKTLPDGRRQVLNFLMPGDLAGLQAGLLGEMRHTAEAVTPMVLCIFSRARLWEMYRGAPERAYDLTWIAAVEEHFLGESLASLGQRDASGRVAWALLRLWQRLVRLGLEDGPPGATSVPLPYRQQDLADALGLSLVHTNKTLSRLRAAGLAAWGEGRLRVADEAGLAAVAQAEVEGVERRPLM